MRIRRISDDVVLVVLPKEPQLRAELAKINETLGNTTECDVIIDFSPVEIITSSSISNLMILSKLLSDRGRQLVLFNVALPTKGIFKTVGLDAVFHFAMDKLAAIAAIEQVKLLKAEVQDQA